MRHRSKKVTLDRKTGPRKALMKGLTISLIEHEKVVTTEAKAKALRPIVERMVTTARKSDGGLSGRRIILSKLYNNKAATKKLVEVIAPRYKDRKGGYIRITKLGVRVGDGGKKAQIEFVK
jgi:large subunit ribosomal protein L17